MIKTYRDLPYKKVYLYRPLLLMGGITILILIIGLFKTGEISLVALLILMLFSIIFFLVPILILYFNYKKFNKDMALHIANHHMTVETSSRKSTFEPKDIDYVEFNLSFSLYTNRWRLFFWDEYYYALIKLKNGEMLVITCLLCDELVHLLPTELVKKRRRIFPLVDLNFEKKQNMVRIENQAEHEKKTQAFIVKFRHKSILELQSIINNKTEYQAEAVQAARLLLEEKKQTIL